MTVRKHCTLKHLTHDKLREKGKLQSANFKLNKTTYKLVSKLVKTVTNEKLHNIKMQEIA